MSARNTLEAKRFRRFAKNWRNTPPAFISLIDFVRDRTRCSRGEARRMILSDCFRVESHTVGWVWETDKDGVKFKSLRPDIPKDWLKDLIVVTPTR